MMIKWPKTPPPPPLFNPLFIQALRAQAQHQAQISQMASSRQSASTVFNPDRQVNQMSILQAQGANIQVQRKHST